MGSCVAFIVSDMMCGECCMIGDMLGDVGALVGLGVGCGAVSAHAGSAHAVVRH